MKISRSSIGRYKSVESRARQSTKMTGRKFSREHRDKMSQAQCERWEKYRLDKLEGNA